MSQRFKHHSLLAPSQCMTAAYHIYVSLPELTEGLSPTVRAYSRISMFLKRIRSRSLQPSDPYVLCRLSSKVVTFMILLRLCHGPGGGRDDALRILPDDLDSAWRAGLDCRLGWVAFFRPPSDEDSTDFRRNMGRFCSRSYLYECNKYI